MRGRWIAIALSLGLAATLATRMPGREIVRQGAARMAEGDVPGARARWCDAATSPLVSAAIDYNLGVAWYREGDAPRALAAWRAARARSPRDPDVAHNLALARARLEGVPAPVGPAVGWLALVTPGEVGGLGAVLLGVASALVGRWRAGRVRARAWALVGGLGLALGLVGIHAAWVQVRHPVAVVVDREAVLRAEPAAGAAATGTLPAGSEVRTDGARGEWLLLRSGDGARGWAHRDGVRLAGEVSDRSECVIGGPSDGG
ncbi:MAG: hypothetical protein JXX28_10055 [Deltaproteobacteria bacterium]|nr:hypothetical protein [Deltaproteobacteria bacterium]